MGSAFAGGQSSKSHWILSIGLDSSCSEISDKVNGSSLKTAVLPARDWVTVCVSAKLWLPVSAKPTPPNYGHQMSFALLQALLYLDVAYNIVDLFREPSANIPHFAGRRGTVWDSHHWPK